MTVIQVDLFRFTSTAGRSTVITEHRLVTLSLPFVNGLSLSLVLEGLLHSPILEDERLNFRQRVILWSCEAALFWLDMKVLQQYGIGGRGYGVAGVEGGDDCGHGTFIFRISTVVVTECKVEKSNGHAISISFDGSVFANMLIKDQIFHNLADV